MSDADDSDNFLPLPGSPANSGIHNDSDSGSGSDHEPRRKVLRQMSIDDDDNSPNLPLEALDEIPYPIDSNKDDDAEQEHDLEEDHEHELEHDIDIDIDIPLPPDSSDSKYSPSQATAEDASPVSVSETNQKKTVAVLGRAQAKKRLQAFSAAKLAATSTTSGSGGKKSSPLKGVSVFSGRSSDSSKQPPLAIASIKEEETKMKEILAMNSLLSEKLKTVHAITTSVPGPSPATAIVKPLNSEFRNSESLMLDKDKAATDLLGKKSDDHMTSFTVKKQIKNIRRKRAMSSSSNSSRSASRSKSPVVKRRGDRDRDRDRRSRSRDKERIKERDRERDRDRGRDRDRDRDRDRMERDRNRDREREKENVKRSKRSRSRSKNRDIVDRKRSKSPKSSKDKQRIKSRSKSRERRGRRSRSRDRKIRSVSRSHSRGRDRDIKEKVREKRKDSSVIRETKKSLSPPIQSRTVDKKSLSKSPSPDLIISSKKLSRSRSHSREKEPSKSRKSRSRSKSVERAIVVEKRKQSRSRSREREGRSSRRRKSPKHKKDKERDREREKEREKAKQLERERREKEEKKEAERRREREKVEAYERELDKVRTTRMPSDWIEYKKFKYSTDHVQDVWKLVLSKEEAKSVKARSRSRSSSRSPARGGTEAEAPLSLGKSLTQHPILIKTTPIDLKSNLKRDYPLCLCKLTKHKPPVDYGPNPLSYAGYFKSREEVFNEEDAEMVKDMTTIVESVTSSVPEGDLPKSQEWFAEHEQIFCPTEGSKGIVISHLYSDDDMDDLSLPAVASKLAAVVKPEKQKKVVSETVAPERPEPPPARSSTQLKPATTIDEEYSSESSQSQDSVPSPLLKKRYESDLLLPTPTTSSSSHGPLELEISGERQPEEETRRRPLSPRSDEIEVEMIEELQPEPAQQPEPLHPIVIPTTESKSQKSSSSKSKSKKEKKKKKKKDSKRRSRHESKGSSKKKASTKSEDDGESDVKGKSSDDSASASEDESGKSKSKKKKSKLVEEETVPVSSSKSKLLKSSSSSVGVVVPEDKKKGKSSSSVSEKSKRKSSKKSRKGKYQSETDDSKRSSSSNSSDDRGSSSSTDSESNEKEKRKKKKKSYKKKKDKDRSRREKDDDTSDGEPGDKDKRGGPPGGSSSGGRGGSSRNQRRDRDYDHRGDRDGHHHKSSKDPDRDRSDRKKSSKHKKRERGNPQQRASSAEDENESSSYSSSSSTTGSSSTQSSSLSTRESFVEEMTRDPDIQFALKGMHVEQGEEDCNNDGQRMIAKLLLDIENDDFNIDSSGGGGRKPAGGDEKYDPFTDTDMLEDAVQIAINRQVNSNNKNTTNKINIKKTDPQKDESSSSSISSSSSTESSDTGAQDLLKTFENDTLLDFVIKNNNDLSTENLLASISGPDATTTAAADNSITLLKDEKKVEQVVTLVSCALASPVIKAKVEVVEHQKQKPVLAVQKQHNRECLPQSEEVPGAELSLNSTEEKPNFKTVDGDHDHEKSGSLLQRESHHHPRLGRIPCKRSYSSSRSRSRSRSVSRSRSRSISPNYRRHNSRSRYSDSYEHDRWSHQQSYDRDRRNDRYRSEDRRSHYVNDEPHNYRSREVVRGDKEIIHYDRLPRYERHRRPHSRDSPSRREYSSSSRHERERERDRDRERSPEEYPRYPPHRRSRFDRGIEREYSDKDRLEFEKHFRDGCLDGNGRHSPDLSEKPITTICSLVGTEGAAQHQQSSPPLRLNVADSTISDSELPDNSVLAYNNSIGGHEGNRANPSNLKEIIPDPELNNSQIRPDNISSGGYASSPKRLSLDERLEMEMGIKLQDEPSSIQHGFPHHRPNYSVHMGKQQKFPAVPSHGPGQSAARSSMLGPNWQNSSTPPTHVQGSYEAPPQPRQSQAIQLGDMLQVLPGEMPERAFTVTKENCKLNPLTVLQYATQVIRKEGDQVDPSKCVTIKVPVVPFKVPVFKHPEPQVYHESQPAQDEEELNRKQRRMELKKIAEKKKLREKKKLMLKKKIAEKKMEKKLRAQALKAAENKGGDAKKEESNSSLASICEKNEGNELEAADPEELKLLKEALTEVPTDASEEGVESCKSEDLPSSEIIPPPDVVSKEEDEMPKPDDMKEADENEDEAGGKGEPASPPQPSSEPFPASACIDFIQPRGILVVAGFRERILSDKPSKAVKFMDGIHPGYGSSRSEGEEIHSPPPVPQNKVLVKKKEKRKKIKIKLKNDEKKTKSKLEVLGEIDPNAPKRPPPPPPKTSYPYCPLGILYQFNPPYAVLYAQAVVEHEFEVTYTPSMEAPRDFSGQCDAVIVDDLLSVQNEKPKQSIPTITTPMPIHEPGVGADTASSWLVSQTTSSERHRRKKHRDREYSKSIDSEVKSADACSESRSSSRSSSSSHHSSHKSAHAQPIPTIVGVMPNSASKAHDFHPTKDIELAENDEGNPDIPMNIPTDTKPTGESSNSKNLISLSSHRDELNIDLYPIQGGHEIQQPPLPYDEDRKFDVLVCRTGSKRDENHRKESNKYHEDHRISRKHADDHRHKHYENHRSDRHKHGVENHRADSYNNKHLENHRSENHHKNSDHKRQGKHGKGKQLEHGSGFKEASQGKEANPNLIPISPSPTTLPRTTIPLPTNSPATLLGSSSISESPKQKNDSPVNETSVGSPDPGIIRIQPKLEDEDQKFSPIPIVSRAKPQIKIKMSTISFASTPTSLALPAVKLMSTSASPAPVPVPKPQVSPVIPTRISTPPTAIISPVSINQMDTTGPPPTHVPPPVHINVPVLHKPTFDYYCQVSTGSNPPHTFPVATPVPPPTSVHIIPGGLPSGIDLTRPPPMTPSFNPIGDVSHVNFSPRKFTPSAPTRIPGNSNLTIVKCTNDLMTIVPPREIITEVGNLGEIPSTPPPPGTSP